MKHEEIQDLLEDYVDDRLDRPTRKVVDDHLKGCAECRAILDDVAPVDISALSPNRFDERVMRRTVRRSLFRTAANTALLLFAGLILVLFLSAFVVQPFIINRGGRAVETAQASIDLTTMVNPGAVLLHGEIQSGILSRDLNLDYVIPVGGSWHDLGTKMIRIGMFGVGGQDGFGLWPYFEDEPQQGDPFEILANLGEGTVATVAIRYDDPMTLDSAQRIADDSDHDVRVVWAGFDATAGRNEFPVWTAGGVLGYGTCQTRDPFYVDSLGGTSASFSQGVGGGHASISSALESVIAGLTNMDEHPGFVADLHLGSGPDSADVRTILASLRTEPSVRTLVVTGPTSEISDLLDDQRGLVLNAQILAIDFYNWTSGICGR